MHFFIYLIIKVTKNIVLFTILLIVGVFDEEFIYLQGLSTVPFQELWFGLQYLVYNIRVELENPCDVHIKFNISTMNINIEYIFQMLVNYTKMMATVFARFNKFQIE